MFDEALLLIDRAGGKRIEWWYVFFGHFTSCWKNLIWAMHICRANFLGPSYWVERVVFLGLAMASVADMLKWKCPPIFIMAVLLLRFGTPDSTRPDSLDFVEIFAGRAELSKSLRQVSKLIYFSPPPKKINPEIHTFLLQPHAPPCCKAQYNGVSIDFDRDMRTQDLLKPAGFLFLGKLQFFEEGSSGSSLNI